MSHCETRFAKGTLSLYIYIYIIVKIKRKCSVAQSEFLTTDFIFFGAKIEKKSSAETRTRVSGSVRQRLTSWTTENP